MKYSTKKYYNIVFNKTTPTKYNNFVPKYLLKELYDIPIPGINACFSNNLLNFIDQFIEYQTHLDDVLKYAVYYNEPDMILKFLKKWCKCYPKVC